MPAALLQAIRARLNADPELLDLIDPSRTKRTDSKWSLCFRARRIEEIDLPCVTLRVKIPQSNAMTGAIAAAAVPNMPIEENGATVNIDVWISSASSRSPNTGEGGDLIAARIHKILMNPATPIVWGSNPGEDTFGWHKLDDQQMPHEDDTRIWHNVLMFGFSFHTMSSGV